MANMIYLAPEKSGSGFIKSSYDLNKPEKAVDILDRNIKKIIDKIKKDNKKFIDKESIKAKIREYIENVQLILAKLEEQKKITETEEYQKLQILYNLIERELKKRKLVSSEIKSYLSYQDRCR